MQTVWAQKRVAYSELILPYREPFRRILAFDLVAIGILRDILLDIFGETGQQVLSVLVQLAGLLLVLVGGIYHRRVNRSDWISRGLPHVWKVRNCLLRAGGCCRKGPHGVAGDIVALDCSPEE